MGLVLRVTPTAVSLYTCPSRSVITVLVSLKEREGGRYRKMAVDICTRSVWNTYVRTSCLHCCLQPGTQALQGKREKGRGGVK